MRSRLTDIMAADRTAWIQREPLVNARGMENMVTRSKASAEKNGVTANRAGLIDRTDVLFRSSRNLCGRGHNGNRVKEIAKDVPRKVNVHDHGCGWRRPVHERAENMKRDPRVPHVRRDDVVPRVSIEESSDCVEAPFRAQNLTEDVQHAIGLVC